MHRLETLIEDPSDQAGVAGRAAAAAPLRAARELLGAGGGHGNPVSGQATACRVAAPGLEAIRDGITDEESVGSRRPPEGGVPQVAPTAMMGAVADLYLW